MFIAIPFPALLLMEGVVGGSGVKPSKILFQYFLQGNSLLGSLVFTRYRERSKKKGFFLLGFRTSKNKRTRPLELSGHLLATSDLVPRSEGLFSTDLVRPFLNPCSGTAENAGSVVKLSFVSWPFELVLGIDCL